MIQSNGLLLGGTEAHRGTGAAHGGSTEASEKEGLQAPGLPNSTLIWPEMPKGMFGGMFRI